EATLGGAPSHWACYRFARKLSTERERIAARYAECADRDVIAVIPLRLNSGLRKAVLVHRPRDRARPGSRRPDDPRAVGAGACRQREIPLRDNKESPPLRSEHVTELRDWALPDTGVALANQGQIPAASDGSAAGRITREARLSLTDSSMP